LTFTLDRKRLSRHDGFAAFAVGILQLNLERTTRLGS